MSNTKMLIDATHPEETRVVVQKNGRVEEFDFESAARKLLRGNIYLAKVTRVEPSLQAAFVEYGGNRHGFLAFNEIHPDYYQIPVADRKALLEAEAAVEAELEAAADRRAEALERKKAARAQQKRAAKTNQASDDDDSFDDDDNLTEDDSEDENITQVAVSENADTSDDETDADDFEDIGGDDDDTDDDVIDVAEPDSDEDAQPTAKSEKRSIEITVRDDDERLIEEARTDYNSEDASQADEESDGDLTAENDEPDDENAIAANAENDTDVIEDGPAIRPRRRPRSYKIQEVIKRRQVILVQVVKEERGNKGAALTTYLSLAGRYTVLMPNTARGGGISRKITNPQDRKRLKAIAEDLDVPEGMGLIIRTAGATRTKQEIRRDFEYLLRLWESVREMTLESTAPCLVYEEGDLIKRSIRDLYNKDVDEIVVAGKVAHKEASDFMKMMMPSHARNVVQYQDDFSLFNRYGVERQLNAMFLPQVTLRSGGYIVINQTEALVAIDVNSGRSTREFSIEQTAVATNLEAADEIARQLKLRDLAGLIVIDFIDMEEKRNNRAVERRLKEALKHDRARIQLGRISHFGLLEMSRQRMRTGVLEGSTSQCPHCQGTGIIRSTESIALAVLRGIEDAISGGANCPLTVTTTHEVALYILNNKRSYVAEMEQQHRHKITIVGSQRTTGANFSVERGTATAATAIEPANGAVNMDWGFEDEAQTSDSNVESSAPVQGDSEEGRSSRSRSRRRRRGRGSRGNRRNQRDNTEELGNDSQPSYENDDAGQTEDVQSDEVEAADAHSEEEQKDQTNRRRRRGRRGGRRRSPNKAADDASQNSDGDTPTEDANESPPKNDADVRSSEENVSPEKTSDNSERTEPENNNDTTTTTEGGSTEKSARPKTRSGGRKKRVWDKSGDNAERASADIAETAVKTEHETVPAESVEAVEAAVPQRPRHELGSSEPRIERIVVGQNEEPAGSNNVASDDNAQTRKGWWQRRFGN